jgi:hypothetical protein
MGHKNLNQKMGVDNSDKNNNNINNTKFTVRRSSKRNRGYVEGGNCTILAGWSSTCKACTGDRRQGTGDSRRQETEH